MTSKDQSNGTVLTEAEHGVLQAELKKTEEEISVIEKDIITLRKNLDSRQQYAASLKQKLGLSDITAKLDQDLKINDEEQKPTKMTKTQKQRAKKAEAEKKRALNVKLDEANAAKGLGANETAILNKILQAKKLRPVSIPSDGDCLYSSIAHQLNLHNSGSKVTGDNVRKQIADYMRKNSDDFLPFMDESMAESSNFETYCMKVEKSCRAGGDWGTATEVKAASSALERPIEIIYSNGNPQTFGEQFKSNPLVITFHQHLLTLGEHYNSTESM